MYGSPGMAGMGGYNGGMYGGGMYGGSMYGGGGMYGNSMYGGSMFGSGGMNNPQSTAPNSFVQEAEASSRGAFQSIESVVHAFSSVSMMLESTYFALHNSFRTVLGVAEQLTRMKDHVSRVVAALAIVRAVRWLYRKLLVLLGLRQRGLAEDAWSEAVQSTGAVPSVTSGSQSHSMWPITLFLGVSIGGPYLIWKLLRRSTAAESWASGRADHVVGDVKYDFLSRNDQELSIKIGQRLILAPAEKQPRLNQNDWFLASIDGENVGFVPANYIEVLGKRKGTGLAPAGQALPAPPIVISEKNALKAPTAAVQQQSLPSPALDNSTQFSKPIGDTTSNQKEPSPCCSGSSLP